VSAAIAVAPVSSKPKAKGYNRIPISCALGLDEAVPRGVPGAEYKILVAYLVRRTVGFNQRYIPVGLREIKQMAELYRITLDYAREAWGNLQEKGLVIRHVTARGDVVYGIADWLWAETDEYNRRLKCVRCHKEDDADTFFCANYSLLADLPSRCENNTFRVLLVIAQVGLRLNKAGEVYAKPVPFTFQELREGSGYLSEGAVRDALAEAERLEVLRIHSARGRKSTYELIPENFDKGDLREVRKVHQPAKREKRVGEEKAEPKIAASPEDSKGTPSFESGHPRHCRCRHCGLYQPWAPPVEAVP
jgi:hypothetical protein